jgi:hypothetical protein
MLNFYSNAYIETNTRIQRRVLESDSRLGELVRFEF